MFERRSPERQLSIHDMLEFTVARVVQENRIHANIRVRVRVCVADNPKDICSILKFSPYKLRCFAVCALDGRVGFRFSSVLFIFY